MRMLMRTGTISLALLLLAAPRAWGAEYLPDKDKVKTAEKDKKLEGWQGGLTLGGTFSFGTNNNVVGKIDGVTMNVGGTFSGKLNYLRAMHEWRNSLDLKEGFARTPSITRFVKSADQLLFESIYLYRFERFPWLGPFARLVLDTPILQGEDVRAEPVTYVYADTLADINAGPVTSQKLTQAFTPLTLKESVGAYGKPLEKDRLSVELRLGFGGMQIFAKDQLAIKDDEDTADQIEVVRLRDIIQAGLELTATASGALSDNKVTYKAGVEVLVPAVNNAEDTDDRGAGELTNVDFFAKLSFKLVSWASLDYEFRALRQPQLVDKWQIQNNLLLTFAYSFWHPKPPEEAKK